jgi:hypothetical protein
MNNNPALDGVKGGPVIGVGFMSAHMTRVKKKVQTNSGGCG